MSEHSPGKTAKDSSPTSDSPADAGAERPDKPSHARDQDEMPTGTPTSDRHATETAHQWEDETKASSKT